MHRKLAAIQQSHPDQRRAFRCEYPNITGATVPDHRGFVNVRYDFSAICQNSPLPTEVRKRELTHKS